MKIIFMGTPEFASVILEELNKKYEISLVVSQPDKEVGRKRILTNPPVISKAKELGLKYFQPKKIKEEYGAIINENADMIVTAAYGQIVPDVVLNSVKKAINVHASLLPKYRGGAPIQRAIINGDKKTGVSIIEMVSKLDAGVIYASKDIDILPSDNNTTMFYKLALLGRDLLLDSIEDIYSGKNKGIPQDEMQVVFSPNIKREEEKLDFNDTAINLFNKIRGLALEPGAYATINGENIKIYSSEIVEYNGGDEAGTILSLKKEILVKTSDKALRLLLIKPSGKNTMQSKDFVNGQKLLNIGDIFD
jgi:methionyl-tRNA formyltransferase